MRYNEGKADELREKFWKALADSPYLFLQLDTHTKSDFAKLGAATATFEGEDHKMFARFHGTLTKETSQERFDQFWNNFVEAWYDGGKDDPDILFLRMDLGDAEIWNGDMGLLDVAKMALGMTVHDDAEEKHVKETSL